MAKSIEVKRSGASGKASGMLRHEGWRDVLGKASRAKYGLLLREIWKNGAEGLSHRLPRP